MSHSDVNGEIFISPHNSMTATYTLYAIDDSCVYAEISAMTPDVASKSTEISVRVSDKSQKDIELDVKYRGISHVYTEIQPMGHEGISTEIEVRPGNRMWVLYEVQEPPRITDTFNPIKDSFTREEKEFQAINYGENNSLTVGGTDQEIYRSFIEFSFNDWNPQFIITESKLRLYYSGLVPEDVKLELLTVDKQWSEYGITHLNRPAPVNLIVNKYKNNIEEKYIEFEFTEIVKAWINQNVENNGFIIRTASESSFSNLINFRSRESTRPPELLVTYYDARVYSTGRSQVSTEIFVWKVGNLETLVEIEVGSVVDDSVVLSELYVHRYEVPIESEIDAEITVTKTYINSEITISIQDDDVILTELSVRSEPMPDVKNTEIIVNKPNQISEIYVKHKNNIDSEITVQRYGINEKFTEIIITREFTDVEIYVKHRNEIDTEITAQRHYDLSANTEITVSRKLIESEIYIKYIESIEVEIEVERESSEGILADIVISRPEVITELTPRVSDYSEIDTEIFVSRWNNNEVFTELSVTRDDIYSEITSRALEYSMAEIELSVRSLDESTSDVQISVSREYVNTEISVVYSSDIDSEIFVKYTEDIIAEINVTVFDQVLTEIEAMPVSKIPVQITITRPNVHTEIVVPYWDDNDKLTEILPRILKASDINVEISIKVIGGAYAFIM